MIDSKAFRSLSYGLYIVSSKDEKQAAGCVVNTFQQVTSTPPRVSVAINKENHTTQVIENSGYYSVVCLAQDATMELIGLFGFQSSRDIDKFSGIACEYDANGMPYPCEQVVARFAVKVIASLDVGTHMLFVGDVVEAESLSSAEPMTYAYYHQVKGGKTPPKASSYQGDAEADAVAASIAGAADDAATDAAETTAAGTPVVTAPEPPAKIGWRCTICGHIEEQDELPEDFVCPVCRKGREFFERITL